MIRYLLDTNICVELIRGRSERVLSHLRRCGTDEVGISAITLAELECGAAKSSDPIRNKALLTGFCAPLHILPFDSKAASVYGQVRFRLEAAGRPIGSLDTLIAAHALALGAKLVTNNLREFARVKGLTTANWAVT